MTPKQLKKHNQWWLHLTMMKAWLSTNLEARYIQAKREALEKMERDFLHDLIRCRKCGDFFLRLTKAEVKCDLCKGEKYDGPSNKRRAPKREDDSQRAASPQS